MDIRQTHTAAWAGDSICVPLSYAQESHLTLCVRVHVAGLAFRSKMSQQWVRTGKGTAITARVQTTTLEVCITNAGPHMRKNVLEKQLADANVLNIKYVDKPKNSVIAFIGFPTVTDRDAGLKLIATLTSKQDKKYSVKLSTRRVPEHILNGTPDPSVKPSEADLPTKRSSSVPVSANDSTAPWLEIPYEEQLQKKQAEIDASLRSVCLGLAKHCTRAGAEASESVGRKRPRPEGTSSDRDPQQQNDEEEEGEGGHGVDEEDGADGNQHTGTAATGPASWAQDERVPSWLRELLHAHDSGATSSSSSSSSSSPRPFMPLPCPVHPIIPSPVLKGYRNKATLTCGLDTSGVPTVGFRLGSYGQTHAVAFPPPGQPLLPQAMISVAAIVQDWMRSSPLPPYDIEGHEGVWRSLTLRWGSKAKGQGTGGGEGEENGEVMVALTAAPPGQKNEGAKSVEGTDTTTSTPADPVAAMQTYNAELERLRAMLTSDVSCSWHPSSAETQSSAAAHQAFKVTSLHVQEYNGRSMPDVNQHPFRLLWSSSTSSEGGGPGRGALLETLCSMTFEISPAAFFQVNTRAAEVLYSTARLLALEGQQGIQRAMTLLGRGAEGAAGSSVSMTTGTCTFNQLVAHKPSPRPTMAIVDVCCGTGTIGLCMAPYVGRVVGVEISADAVADAVRNAQLNSASNAMFVAQRAETAMKDILTIAEKGAGASSSSTAGSSTAPASSSASPYITQIVAIVDPPRGGLHPSVIHALRTCKALKRLVYVSCNPGVGGSFVEDAVKLMAPQEGTRKSAYARGPAFRLSCAVPMDLFPHTPHTELVALFERD